MRIVNRTIERLVGKRIKWEPMLAMVVVLLLGLWLVSGPSQLKPTPGTWSQPVRIGSVRGIVEVDPAAQTYGVRLRGGESLGPFTADEFAEHYGLTTLQTLEASRGNWVFRLLNITSWGSVVWVTVGLLGQCAFFGRMMIQWIASEKSRASVIPEAFWWLSLMGGVSLFAYFVWRQDPIGVLGQTTGVVIYARNIRLNRKRLRREQREAAARAETLSDAEPPE